MRVFSLSYLLLALFCTCGAGCISCDSGGCGLSGNSGSKPECDATTDLTGWTGDPGYVFEITSFACQTDPVYPAFFTDETTFVDYGDGISGTGVFQSAMKVAGDMWNNVASPVVLDHDEFDNTSSGAYIEDGDSQIFMVDTFRVESTAAAKSIARYDPADPGAGTTECDVQFYAKLSEDYSIPWDLDEAPSGYEFAFSTVMAHEYGHCLGLLDNALAESMMNGAVSERETRTVAPGSEDWNAVIYLYGALE